MTDAPENSTPIAYAIEDVPAHTGINRCKIFKAIRDGDLCARKVGRSTIIEDNELRRWIASLPTRGRPQAELNKAHGLIRRRPMVLRNATRSSRSDDVVTLERDEYMVASA